jgi:acyl-coenzyme A thioesterase PaaI-like protein
MSESSYNHCFVCGKDNPIGLHLNIDNSQEVTRAEFVVPEHMDGFKGILHGGVICALLDDIMFYATIKDKTETMTVKLETAFKHPALTGDHLICEGWITHRKGRVFNTAGRILKDDIPIAEAQGVYVTVDLGKVLN